MYNHNKAQQSKNRVHISWDILYMMMMRMRMMVMKTIIMILMMVMMTIEVIIIMNMLFRYNKYCCLCYN